MNKSWLYVDFDIEAIAMVMNNWHNVLRAINMASGKPFPIVCFRLFGLYLTAAAKLAKTAAPQDPESTPLPQTLVRIPTEHAPALQAHADGAVEEE